MEPESDWMAVLKVEPPRGPSWDSSGVQDLPMLVLSPIALQEESSSVSCPASPLLFPPTPDLYELSRQQPSVATDRTVEPPWKPLPEQPIRTTNQLLYLQNTVMKGLWKKKESVPFRVPVDVVQWRIPDYFQIVRQPMDLTTIKKRLKSGWYRDAQDCLADFDLMFENCRMYNGSNDDTTVKAEKMAASLKNRLESLPKPEQEMPLTVEPDSDGTKQGRAKAKKTTRAPSPRTDSPEPQQEKPRSRANRNGRKPSAAASKAKEEPTLMDALDGVPLLTPSQADLNWVRPGPGSPTGDPLAECKLLITELLSPKHEEYARPFYSVIRRSDLMPMDLKTIQARLMAGQYLNADEVAEDVRLMFSNCYRTCTPTDPLVAKALRLQKIFEMRFARFPLSSYRDAAVIEQRAAFSGQSDPCIRKILATPVDDQSMRRETEKEELRVAQIANIQMTVKLIQKQVASLAGSSGKKLAAKKTKGETEKSPAVVKTSRSKKNATGMQSALAKNIQKKVSAAKNNTAAAELSVKKAKALEGTLPVIPNSLCRPNGQKATPPDNGPSTSTVSYDSETDRKSEDMTYEQKRHLSKEVSALQPEDIVSVFKIIKEMEPDFCDSPEDDELEIDFDTMKPATLRRLENFVASRPVTATKPESDGPKNSTKRRQKRRVAGRNNSSSQSPPKKLRTGIVMPDCPQPTVNECRLSDSSSSDDDE